MNNQQGPSGYRHGIIGLDGIGGYNQYNNINTGCTGKHVTYEFNMPRDIDNANPFS